VQTLLVFEEHENLVFLYQFVSMTDLFLRRVRNKLIDLPWLIFHISPSSNYYFQLLRIIIAVRRKWHAINLNRYRESNFRVTNSSTARSAIVTAHFTIKDLLFVYPTVPCICIYQQFHYPEYFFVYSRTKWNCLEIAVGGLYRDFLLDRVSGAMGSEIHREIKWPGKRRNNGNNSCCRQCYAW